MVTQRHFTSMASAPALLGYRDTTQQAGEWGTVLFSHGFGRAKEESLAETALGYAM